MSKENHEGRWEHKSQMTAIGKVDKTREMRIVGRNGQVIRYFVSGDVDRSGHKLLPRKICEE